MLPLRCWGPPGVCTSPLPGCPMTSSRPGRQARSCPTWGVTWQPVRVRVGPGPSPQTPPGAANPRQVETESGLHTPPSLPRKEGRQLEEEPYGPDSRLPGDKQEQDLTSQLLSRLKIFTSKYVPMCHIFASSQPGSLSSPPGRKLCRVGEGLFSRGAESRFARSP